jgi:hypothetical protein
MVYFPPLPNVLFADNFSANPLIMEDKPSIADCLFCKSSIIDLTTKYIFEYVGEKVSDNPKILFTEEEKRFIHSKGKID